MSQCYIFASMTVHSHEKIWSCNLKNGDFNVSESFTGYKLTISFIYRYLNAILEPSNTFTQSESGFADKSLLEKCGYYTEGCIIKITLQLACQNEDEQLDIYLGNAVRLEYRPVHTS